MQPPNFTPPHDSPYAGTPGAAPPRPPRRFAGGVRADLGRAFSETLQEFTQDLGPYALAGLGLTVVMLLPTVLIGLPIGGFVLFSIFASAAAASRAGGSAASPTMSGVLMLVMIVVFLLVMVLCVAVLAGFMASLLRAVAAHQRGESRLAFGSVFATVRHELGKNVGVGLAVSCVTLLGVLLCYVPGLIAAFLLWLAGPLVALHGVPVGTALRLSTREVRSDLGWHLKYFGLWLVINMIAQYIPVLGPMFALAFSVRVFRELAGDGPTPQLPSVAH